MSTNDCEVIEQLSRQSSATDAAVDSTIQQTLASYCIAVVEIRPDKSVTVSTMAPELKLQQGGWTSYLIKIKNKAGYMGKLKVKSPHAQPLFVETRGQTRMVPEEMFTAEQLHQRYLALSLYRNAPLGANLSGNRVEYAILQLYSKKSGRAQADLDFYIDDYYKDMRPIESSYLRPPKETGESEGLKGEYFGSTTPSGKPILERIDKEINFNWTSDYSLGDAVDMQKFSARWTGHLVAPKTGRYRLGVRSNDGSRIYLDGKLFVSNWASQGSTLKTAEIEFLAGQPRDLNVEYFQEGGSADVRLEWDDGPLNPTRISMKVDAAPAVPVVLHIRDEDGAPAMASFTITDGIERYERLVKDENAPYGKTLNYGLSDYDRRAQREYEYYPDNLKGIYPLPSKRQALIDTYPDQYFHAQVYRKDGEHVILPPGSYRVAWTRGPEYTTQSRTIIVPRNAIRTDESFQLKRWISMRQLGYYSSDSHIHASGCCYCTNPEEGLRPEYVWRFQLGEDLNVANILNWGGNWYHQKSFFTGHNHPHSDHHHIMRYNVEVSGFPSSHAGHVVLLGIKEDDYPGTAVIEDWPTWNLPILKWAKGQHAITGYAHSGWGLTPMDGTWELPNHSMPRMDDIGANEYIVTVTEGVVDFYSVGDTPITWELNMWYHSLNCGFRPRLSGETDFPCIYDERVGEARSYVRLDGDLDYGRYLDGIRRGCGYVSDGRTHLIDFSVDDLQLGAGDSVLNLKESQTVKISAKVAAFLPVEQSEVGKRIAASGLDHQPYWHIERARIGTTGDILVELIVNGVAVDSKRVAADGSWKSFNFEHEIAESSWLALRVFPSAHTNPIFVTVDEQPIRNRRSAQWCRRAVDQCWKMKQGKISAAERDDAIEAFDRARSVYDRMIDQ
ncbi:MAG: CehA/McbA family metallohydrolase [Pirellulales bacterium]